MDKDGNLYQINAQGQVIPLGKKGGEAWISKTEKKLLDNDVAVARFVEHTTKQVYAFDDWKAVYAKSSQFNKEYEKIKCVSTTLDGSSGQPGFYYVGAKAIAPGKTDYLKCVVTRTTGSTINLDSVQFVTGKGIIYNKTAIDSTASSKTFEVAIIGGPEKDAQEVYVLYPRAGSKTLNFGKLLVASYPRKEYKVKLVPVNGTNFNYSKISDSLNYIYGKLNISFNVSVDNNFSNALWDSTQNGLDVREAGSLSVYSKEMKQLNNVYKNERGVAGDGIYLFLLDHSGDSTVKGIMPRGKQFGYIFYTGNQFYEKTVAHELGHGKFTLKHIFDYGDFSNNDLPENVLNNFDGISFCKFQWDLLHDPAIVFSLFDDEGEGLSLLEPHIKCVKDQNVLSIIGKTFYDPDGFNITLPEGAMPYGFFGHKETEYFGRLAAYKYQGKTYIYYVDVRSPETYGDYAKFYAPLDGGTIMQFQPSPFYPKSIKIDANDYLNGQKLNDCGCDDIYTKFRSKNKPKINEATIGLAKKKLIPEFTQCGPDGYNETSGLEIHGGKSAGQFIVEDLNRRIQQNKDAGISFGTDFSNFKGKNANYFNAGSNYRGDRLLKNKITWEEVDNKFALLEMSTGYQFHFRVVSRWCTYSTADANLFAEQVFVNSNISKSHGIYLMVFINEKTDGAYVYTFGIAFGTAVTQAVKDIVTSSLSFQAPETVEGNLINHVINIYKQIPKKRIVYSYFVTIPTQDKITERNNKISAGLIYGMLTATVRCTVGTEYQATGNAIAVVYYKYDSISNQILKISHTLNYELKEEEVKEYGLKVAKILGAKICGWNFDYWDGSTASNGSGGGTHKVFGNGIPYVPSCSFTLMKSCSQVSIDNIFLISTLVLAPTQFATIPIVAAIVYYGATGQTDEAGEYLLMLAAPPVVVGGLTGTVELVRYCLKLTTKTLKSLYVNAALAIKLSGPLNVAGTRTSVELFLNKPLIENVSEYLVKDAVNGNTFVKFKWNSNTKEVEELMTGSVKRVGTQDEIKVSGYMENSHIALESSDAVDAAVLNELKVAAEGVSGTSTNLNFAFKNGYTKEKIIEIPKGQRPPPNSYLFQNYIDSHLEMFNNGVTKFSSQAPTGAIGPPGGTFVMPKIEADVLIQQAEGDISKLEDLLGLNRGDLGVNPQRIDVQTPPGLRMPDGNELGTNQQWLPGGKTSGGVNEATVNQIQPGSYTTKPVF
jgi:hypothetical protein